MLRIIGALSFGVFALAAGCGNNSPIVSKSDLGMSSDLGVTDQGGGSLGPDMSTTLPVPTGCNTATVVTGTQAYTTLTGSNGQRCMGGNCHNNNNRPLFTNQTSFMAAVRNQSSTTPLPYVTPNVPDRSFLLYKLANRQATVLRGGGVQMPRDGTPLTSAEQCVIYNWVLHGAPVN